MLRTLALRGALAASATLALASCSSTPASDPATDPASSPAMPSASASATIPPSDLALSSTDFVDGGPLDLMFAASGANCPGQNISPELSWTGAPEGTVTYALFLLDLDANNWSHLVLPVVPGDVTEIPRDGWRDLPNPTGLNSTNAGGYFGPCPPDPGHHYQFVLWALDTELTFDDRPRWLNVVMAAEGHILGEATITGIF